LVKLALLAYLRSWDIKPSDKRRLASMKEASAMFTKAQVGDQTRLRFKGVA
jgi:hypothetical protein